MSSGGFDRIDGLIGSELTDYAEVLLAWSYQTSNAAASEGRWEPNLVNDKQLGDYPEEFAHQPSQ